ncbi:PREDICTED: uncharacterized protein LOC104822216 [Tarenaya hassleriana]|uniref:uncharacterized protein LOC104822216 n=1 Tax=Tarenaya hassleriana TaxID=28532 RepID=UPI00053C834A|nr:PREDICTED: uncharacterized protein LOC104822216 [Tarenaya hassleriana]
MAKKKKNHSPSKSPQQSSPRSSPQSVPKALPRGSALPAAPPTVPDLGGSPAPENLSPSAQTAVPISPAPTATNPASQTAAPTPPAPAAPIPSTQMSGPSPPVPVALYQSNQTAAPTPPAPAAPSTPALGVASDVALIAPAPSLCAEDFPPLPGTAHLNPAAVGSKIANLLRNLSRVTTPVISADGKLRVRVPSSVLLEASQTWKGHLVGHFLGVAPSGSKIFQSLNPIWGWKSRIHVRRVNDSTCLFHVADLSTREWILEVGIWRVGDTMFTVAEWSPTASFRKTTLKSAPVWVSLSDIPAELYSLQGISYISCGIGEPLHTERMRLDPFNVGRARVKIEVQLGSPLPDTIEIEDDSGGIVVIKALYDWLPPRCTSCHEFGHREMNCFLKQSRIVGHKGTTSNRTTDLETPKVLTDVSPPPHTPAPPHLASEVPPSASATASPRVSLKSMFPSSHPSVPQEPPLWVGHDTSSTTFKESTENAISSPQDTHPSLSQPKLVFDTKDQPICEAQRVLRTRNATASRALDGFTEVQKARRGRAKHN